MENFMALDGFFKNVGQTIKKATDKIDNTVDVQKVKYRISKKEEEIDEIYRSLGKEVLDAHGQGKSYADAIDKAMCAISVIRSEILVLEAERRSLEGKYLCQSCGFETGMDDDFCPKCGAKLEKDASYEHKSEETKGN